MRFRNQVVVVTGAGSPIGIGREVALAFAREGARVVAGDVDYQAVRETVELLAKAGGDAVAVPCDVSVTADVETMVQTARSHFGTVDVLVNNAGIAHRAEFLTMSDEEWSRTQEVNIGGCYRCARAVAPAMVEQGRGRIVNVSSLMGSPWGWADHVHYSASKAAIEGFTRALAVELGPRGITVNAVAPGFIWTAQSTSVKHSVGPDGLKAAVGYIPLRRIGQPADIADVILFLASDAARYVTGQTLLADGGITLGDLSAAFSNRAEG
jgi:3-oxoacyl-[acyl-carrier protein] reductase